MSGPRSTSSSPLTVTQVDPDDASRWAEPIAKCWHEVHVATFAYLPGHYSIGRLRYHLASRVLIEQQVFVTGDIEEVTGFASVQGDLLTHLYVVPPQQRRGAGTSLLACALAWVTGPLHAHVLLRNRVALRFYEARGFTMVGTRHDPTHEHAEALLAHPNRGVHAHPAPGQAR